MTKNAVILTILGLICLKSEAQQAEKPNAYNKGDHHFQLGIGYPNLAGLAIARLSALDEFTNTDVSAARSIPKINFNYDYALDQNFSLGMYLGFSSTTTPQYNWEIPTIINPFNPDDVWFEGGEGEYQYRVTSFSFGGRGLRHFSISKAVDLYARGSIGFSINKIKTLGDEIPSNVSGAQTPTIPLPEIALSGHFGARYFFSENWGAYGEVGYSTTDIIQVGVSYRILRKENPTSKN